MYNNNKNGVIKNSDYKFKNQTSFLKHRTAAASITVKNWIPNFFCIQWCLPQLLFQSTSCQLFFLTFVSRKKKCWAAQDCDHLLQLKVNPLKFRFMESICNTAILKYFEFFRQFIRKQNMIKKNYQLNRKKKFVDKAQQCFAF